MIATSAWAAVAPPCTPATITPTATVVPANLPGFGYTALTATANDVHLFATGATRTEVALTVGPAEGGLLKVKPSALVPGMSYELDYASFCSYGAYPPAGPLMFSVVAESPIPTKVGELQGVPTVVLKDYGTTQYTITASYSLDAEMKPWTGVYQMLVLLDGKPVDTKPTATADGVQVVGIGWCDQANAALKTHTIGLRARLPFTPNVDSAVVTADFSCPAPAFTTPPGGGAVPPGTGTGTGNGNGNGNGSGSSSKEASGCSIGTTNAPLSTLPFVGVALGLVALLRRRVTGA